MKPSNTATFRALALAVAALTAFAPAAAAPIRVLDDTGRVVELPRPARRVISLAPHATELIYAAGGGERIVGTVEYSDHPPEARRLPRVGDHRLLDLERIAAAKPDLLVVWLHGSAERQLDKLRALGIPLFYSESHTLDNVPDSIERLGRLLGTESRAGAAARGLRERLAKLRAAYRQRPPVTLFYQVWDRPLMTLNGKHLVGDMLRACGGVNPFAHLPLTAPSVDPEAVLAADPEVIIGASSKGEAPVWMGQWRRYPGLAAVRRGNLFTLDADLVNRQGPRAIDGTELLCRRLDEARAKRGAKRGAKR